MPNNKKGIAVVIIIIGLLIGLWILQTPATPAPQTQQNTKCDSSATRIVFVVETGSGEQCVYMPPRNYNQLVDNVNGTKYIDFNHDVVWGVQEVCTSEEEVIAWFDSTALPDILRPRVGRGYVYFDVLPHHCREVHESTVLNQKHMAVTGITISPPHKEADVLKPLPTLQRDSTCGREATLSVFSSSGVLCFVGPGEVELNIEGISRIAARYPVDVSCKRPRSEDIGAYMVVSLSEGIGVYIGQDEIEEAGGGTVINIKDVLPGFQPTFQACRIIQKN